MQHVGKAEDTGAVAKQVIAAATAENTAQTWERMGSCGLVVGATVGEVLKELAIDLSTFNGPILRRDMVPRGLALRTYTEFLQVLNLRFW